MRIGRILPHDVVRTIRRAITDDNPFDWPDGLRHYRLNRQFDRFGLVASGSDQDIAGEGQHVFIPVVPSCMNVGL
jgi:hypothetical protein